MEYLGSRNLFFSHFVIGTIPKRNKDNFMTELNVLYQWMKFKDEDWGMKNYRTSRTQYIAVPHIIELLELKQIIYDLYLIYKRSNPYSKHNDFIAHVLSYTLHELKEFISWEPILFGHFIDNYSFYYVFDHDSKEYFDFIIEGEYTIDHYQQYYKRVISFIDNIDFDGVEIESKKYSDNAEAINKLKIVLEIIGDNDVNPSKIMQPVFHYIPRVLKEHNLTYLEAANLLADLRGAFSPETNENVISKIIIWLKEKNDLFEYTFSKENSTIDDELLKDLNKKVDAILEKLTELGYGEEIIFDEIQELKTKGKKISLKDFKLLLIGKLVALGAGKLLNEKTVEDILKLGTDITTKLIDMPN